LRKKRASNKRDGMILMFSANLSDFFLNYIRKNPPPRAYISAPRIDFPWIRVLDQGKNYELIVILPGAMKAFTSEIGF
jgi:hypothetical protein